jgi:uncharacterized protein YjeT (DUF2065 family)
MESFKNNLGIVFFITGLLSYFFPEFNGFWADPLKITIAEGRLIGVISMIGGAILFFMPTDKK